MFVNPSRFFLKHRRVLNSRLYFPAPTSSTEANPIVVNENTKDRVGDKFQNKVKMKERYREYYIRNKEKIKERDRAYYLKNKDKKKEYDREYRNLNKEKLKENSHEYYIQNSDKLKESARENYIQNKDKVKAYTQKYRIQNKEKKRKYHEEYRVQNRVKIKESNRKYYVQNKEKKKEYNQEYYIQRNIERNNGIYVTRKSWKSSDSVREYFESIAPLLHINDLSDWYRISKPQIIEMKGRGLYHRYSSLGEALTVAYPEYDWDMSKFSFRGKKSTQRWLYVKLKKLLPNTVIEEEYNHPELLWEENTNKYLQLDIWISEYNLALEYQGEHHYFDLPGAFGPGSTTVIFTERDEKKKQLCASKGINLVCIPYWWDGHEDSLSSTLHAILPDVFQKTDSPPIPANLPTDYQKKE